MSNPINRRNFISNTAVSALAALALTNSATAKTISASRKKVVLAKNDVVLFQGDSVTAASRNRTVTLPNTAGAMGTGYVNVASASLLLANPEKNLTIFNRGIAGNKVTQLAERWDEDALTLKPNIFSILIGVNDFWHTLTHNYQGTAETYRTEYKKLLDRTLQALPDVKLIIGEPFAIAGQKAVTEQWYPKFDQIRAAAHDVAGAYNAIFIPYQQVFNDAIKLAPADYWSTDGVHPTLAGASLMAQAWLKFVK